MFMLCMRVMFMLCVRVSPLPVRVMHVSIIHVCTNSDGVSGLYTVLTPTVYILYIYIYTLYYINSDGVHIDFILY